MGSEDLDSGPRVCTVFYLMSYSPSSANVSKTWKLGMVAHAFNLNIQEAEAGRSKFQASQGYRADPVSKQTNNLSHTLQKQNKTKQNKKLDILYRSRSYVLNVH